MTSKQIITTLNEFVPFPVDHPVNDNDRFRPIYYFLLVTTIFCGLLPLHNCSAQPLTDSLKAKDLMPQISHEKLRFKVQVVKKNGDGSKVEIDTTSGYQKFYGKNGILQMEGKVIPRQPKGYRDGIWNYYDEQGLLAKQETYKRESKLREVEFLYFKNGKPLSETLQFFEGNYKDKASFKFIKIEVIFYTNGQKLSERHSVNGKFVYETCWDTKGHQRPIEYLKTVKSFSGDK